MENKEEEIRNNAANKMREFGLDYGCFTTLEDYENCIKALSEWVSVKDRLPKTNGFYYVFIETDNPDGNEYHDVVHYSKAGWHIPNDDHVTHWQPLLPPKSV